jgi:superfamily II DNA/RNA helicase
MPTRELAVQCYNVAVKLATFTDVTFCQLIGGFSLREQENVLKKRPDVIIATPGRFIDHMRNSPSFTVDTLEIMVLDEADRMLEDGFADELNEILTTIPKSRQTMLFSATMTDSVDKLIRVGMNPYAIDGRCQKEHCINPGTRVCASTSRSRGKASWISVAPVQRSLHKACYYLLPTEKGGAPCPYHFRTTRFEGRGASR